MNHICNICQLEPPIIKKIAVLASDGLAQRKIVQSVNDEFKTSMTQASLNRHLNNCGTLAEDSKEVTQNLGLVRQKSNLPTVAGSESFKALCRLFHENMESYANKVNIKISEGVDVSEDDLKELELLVKTHERLYPKEAENNRMGVEGLHFSF
jgi:glycerol-3-phosphate responsive antiterminator